MKKVDLNLLNSIGKPRAIVDGMLDLQVEALEASLGRKAGGTGNKILSLFVKNGYRVQLTEEVVIKKMKAITKLSEDEIGGLIYGLYESDLLRKTSNEQYELANNFIARKAFEKVEAENRVLRTIKSTINDRMSRNELLDRLYLNYISPSLTQLELNTEESDFVKKSEKAVRRRRRLLNIALIILFLLMGILAIGAVYNYQRANKALIESRDYTKKLEAEKEKTEMARADAEAARGEAEESRDDAKAERNNALESQRIAEQLRNTAIADRDSIIQLKIAADALVVELEKLRKEAEGERNNALKSKEIAEKSEAISEELRLKAEQINKIITSRIAANRSLQIEDNHMRSLVALEAYKINKNNSEGDIYHPNIVKALYSAVEAKNEDFFVEKEIVGSVKDIIVNASGNVFYTTGSDGKVREWQVNQWNQIGKPEINTIIEFEEQVDAVHNALALSADGRRILVAGESPSFQVLDTRTKKRLSQYNFGPKGEQIYTAEFDEEGNFCGMGRENAYFLFEGYLGNIKTQQFSYTKKEDNRSPLISIEKLPSKVSLFRKIGGEIRAYSIHGEYSESAYGYLTKIQRIDGENNRIEEYTQAFGGAEEVDYGMLTAVEFKQLDKKNGLLVYGFSSGKIMIVRSEDLEKMDDPFLGDNDIFKAHQAAISDMKFSKNGNFLAIASYDGSVSVWDMSRYNDAAYQPMVFDMPSWVLSVAFAHDDDVLITGCKDGSIYFWNINPDDYANYLCSSLFDGRADYAKKQEKVNRLQNKSGGRGIQHNEISKTDYERYFGEMENRLEKWVKVCE